MESASKYVTSAGRVIYGFPVAAFPGLVANVYIIGDGQSLVLVDTGSGREESNKDLMAGLEAIRERFGVTIGLADLDCILITHGHIDHFGGLPFVRRESDAPIGVHRLDRRVLSHYEERVVVASRRLETFLRGAGVPVKYRANLMAMYLFAKGIYYSTPVQFTMEDGRPALDEGIMENIGVVHVPGHCPGQVNLRVDDILLTADHVLSFTTPHQAPESITNNMGLGHYLDSLAKIEKVAGIRLALGGHEEPMADLHGRVGQIREMHQERLFKILELAKEPMSTAAISQALFGQVSSYHVLLALEETGAHVEYLYQLGELAAANLDEIENDPDPVIKYRRM